MLFRSNPESPVAASCVDKDDDKVYGKLGSIRARLQSLEALFGKESFISVIVNPDELSVSEALRIQDELTKLSIPISAICLNKQGVSDARWSQDSSLAQLPQFVFDFARKGIQSRESLHSIGTDALVRYYLDQEKDKR